MGIVEDLSRRLPPDTAPTGVSFEWDEDGVGRWQRHENAGDRSTRKTAELRARSFIMSQTDTASGPQPGYYGFRDAPEPAPSFWRPKLDKAGLWSAYATAAFCVVALVFLFT